MTSRLPTSAIQDELAVFIESSINNCTDDASANFPTQMRGPKAGSYSPVKKQISGSHTPFRSTPMFPRTYALNVHIARNLLMSRGKNCTNPKHF